jgi:hypothetical protein
MRQMADIIFARKDSSGWKALYKSTDHARGTEPQIGATKKINTK